MKTIKISCCRVCPFSDFPAIAETCFHPDTPIENCDIENPEIVLHKCPLVNHPVTIYYLPSGAVDVRENSQ